MPHSDRKIILLAAAFLSILGWLSPAFVVPQDAKVAPSGPGQTVADNSDAAVDNELNGPAAAGETPEDDESPFLVEPTTPDEVFRAAQLSMRIGRPQLAKRYLERLMEMNPDDAVLVELRDKYGLAAFLSLANTAELQPVSVTLLERMNNAFRQYSTSPERIAALVADLGSGTRKSELALMSLRNAVPDVVPALLTYIRDTQDPDQRDLLVVTLGQFGKQAVPPLIAALDSPDPRVVSAAIEALGRLGFREAVDYLWHPAFGERQEPGTRVAARLALSRILRTDSEKVERVSAYGVAGELSKRAMEHFRNEYPWPIEDDGLVEIWRWNPEMQAVVLERMDPKSASLDTGLRFAEQALDMAPDKPEIQALFLASTMAAAMHEAGWDNPLPTGPGTAYNLGLTAGPDVLRRALSLSLANRNSAAAVAALHVLSQVGTPQELYDRTAETSPIQAALNYPDERVQFAAAAAVMQLDPLQPFRGAERVVDILARTLNGKGSRRAVVVDADVERASTVAGLLGELGFEVRLVRTGREGFRVAAEEINADLIVLHMNTIRWDLSQTVANLRADARTAGGPIAVYGPDEMRGRLDSLIDRYSNMMFLAESSTSEHFSSQLRPFLEKVSAPPLSPVERRTQSDAAAYWLAHIAGGRRTSLYPIERAEAALITATNDPAVALNALIALGAIPTQTVQQQFQQIAISTIAELDLREAAALHLAIHIQRFGLLLSDKEVAEVETSWRETTDPRLATALAGVVGSLKPDATRVGVRLRKSPQASAPSP